MSFASPFMDESDRARGRGRMRERVRVEAPSKPRWSARRTLALVVLVSAAFWGLVVVLVQHLH